MYCGITVCLLVCVCNVRSFNVMFICWDEHFWRVWPDFWCAHIHQIFDMYHSFYNKKCERIESIAHISHRWQFIDSISKTVVVLLNSVLFVSFFPLSIFLSSMSLNWVYHFDEHIHFINCGTAMLYYNVCCKCKAMYKQLIDLAHSFSFYELYHIQQNLFPFEIKQKWKFDSNAKLIVINRTNKMATTMAIEVQS